MQFNVSRASRTTPPCDGAIKSDDGWTIELSSLDELLAFIDKNDEKIVLGHDTLLGRHEIVIYDDYIE